MSSRRKKSVQPDNRIAPQIGPQVDAITADWCRELLFGGARGGGKSFYLLLDFIKDVARYGSAWQGILFRRTYNELSELARISKEFYPKTLAEWKEGKYEWHWPNGSILRFRHLERDDDVMKYQGHAYPWLGFDELGNIPSEDPYRALFATNRPAVGNVHIPNFRIRCTANPGGPGHQWIKKRFIDPYPLGYTPIDDPVTGWTRMFIPSKVTDNKILLARDPNYINVLKGVGSEALVRAWLDGDWSVVTGAYFTEFSIDKHVIPPFEIPYWWARFVSLDWGYAKPFAASWWAVSDGSLDAYPPGALINYREWYGWNGEANKGLRLDVGAVVDGIVNRSIGETIEYVVVDPSMYKEDGGPCLAESFVGKISVKRGDNNRIPGWQEFRKRLIGESSQPLVYFFSTCTEAIRTIPALQHDRVKAEDLDTDGEDHSADSVRYGCMSRPYFITKPSGEESPRYLADMTFQEIWENESKYRIEKVF